MGPEPELCGAVGGRGIDQEDIDYECEGEVKVRELEICMDWLTDFAEQGLKNKKLLLK